MTFTNAQREAVEKDGLVAITIDGIDYVVLRRDAYNRLKSTLAEGLGHEDLRSMLGRSAENSDWLDPVMDIYDDYDNHR